MWEQGVGELCEQEGRLAVSCVPGLVTASRQGLGPASASASPLEVRAVLVAAHSKTALVQKNIFHGAGRQLCASPASDVFWEYCSQAQHWS